MLFLRKFCCAVKTLLQSFRTDSEGIAHSRFSILIVDEECSKLFHSCFPERSGASAAV